MGETEAGLCSRPCYLLFLGTGTEESQSVNPDLFLPRARTRARPLRRAPDRAFPGLALG
jgi:hypothetical protein